MSRSLKKGPYVDPKLMRKIDRLNETKGRQVVRTWSRANIPIYITENMVGHKLGEFAPTRTFRGHISRAERKGSRRV
jgi:small subunit ribosomal protein S19